MFRFLQNWKNQRILQRSVITATRWTQLFDSLPLLEGLTHLERQRLQDLATLFCHYKNFEGADGLVVTESMRLTIALQACLPILHFDRNPGLDAYDGWVSIVVYPAGFAPDHVYVDAAGVEHVERRDLAGESWLRGPVILSWEDVENPDYDEGYNLVIHEFVHKLDMQNGDANGFPPLHKEMDTLAWTDSFQAGFEDLYRQCELGVEREIDCYAASSPAEFFAVLSESFFMRPGLLLRRYPDIYLQLSQYYRQDPARRLA